MEKKEYVTPEMEVIELENDAILTSNGGINISQQDDPHRPEGNHTTYP